MFQLKPRSINDMLIAVTDTATLLYTLVDTASSSPNSQSYYGNETNPGSGVANCVSIRAQDGDVRVVIDATPTATKGFLIRSGTRYFFNGEISKMKLIRASGAATVACDIDFWKAERGEIVSANTDTITATVDSEFPAASALADATANPTTTTTGANLMVFNGTTWDRARSSIIIATSTVTGMQNTLPEAIYRGTSLSKVADQVSPLESDSAANLKITEATQIAGEDLAKGVLKTETRVNYTNISASALIATGAGTLSGFFVNSCAATATIKFWAQTTAAVPVLLNTITFTAAEAQGGKFYRLPEVEFTAGLYCTIAVAAADLTIFWKQ